MWYINFAALLWICLWSKWHHPLLQNKCFKIIQKIYWFTQKHNERYSRKRKSLICLQLKSEPEHLCNLYFKKFYLMLLFIKFCRKFVRIMWAGVKKEEGRLLFAQVFQNKQCKAWEIHQFNGCWRSDSPEHGKSYSD